MSSIKSGTRLATAAAGALALSFCPLGSPVDASAPTYGYTVLHVYPHDPDAFTQGLIVSGDFFYEGTGLYGFSSLRKVDVETGTVLKEHDLGIEYFGEGITALRDTIYQITWQNHEGFSYVEGDTFEVVDSYPYPWDGWGLTHDGTHLIASDGSPTIRFLDPRTREETSEIEVADGDLPVDDLNELEYVQGRIYANVWYDDRIAVIDRSSGQVEAWLNLAGLRDSVSSYPQANVLNGIAYDPAGNRLFVTGKRWPKLFEIDVATLHAAGIDERTHPDMGLVPRCVPNPCRDRAFLTFATPRESKVSLRVLDVRGRPVLDLPSEDRWGPGDHRVPLDLTKLSSGAYFVQLVAGQSRGTARLLVVR